MKGREEEKVSDLNFLFFTITFVFPFLVTVRDPMAF